MTSHLHVRDAKDRPFLDLADHAPEGTILITGDQDLHAIRGARFRILTPARFMAEFLS